MLSMQLIWMVMQPYILLVERLVSECVCREKGSVRNRTKIENSKNILRKNSK